MYILSVMKFCIFQVDSFHFINILKILLCSLDNKKVYMRKKIENLIFFNKIIIK